MSDFIGERRRLPRSAAARILGGAGRNEAICPGLFFETLSAICPPCACQVMVIR